MNNRKTGTASTHTKTFRNQRGISLVEIVVAIAVITVVAGVVIPTVFNEFEKAKVAGCKAEVDLMKAVAYDLGDGRYIPNPTEYWAEGFPDAEEGEYYYIVDEQDHNKGHGNDLDGCDEDNPGNSPRCPGADIKFVVLCNHDHGEFGKYVFATEQDAPTVVEVGGFDPGYKAWLSKDNTNGSGKVGKKPVKPGNGNGNGKKK